MDLLLLSKKLPVEVPLSWLDNTFTHDKSLGLSPVRRHDHAIFAPKHVVLGKQNLSLQYWEGSNAIRRWQCSTLNMEDVSIVRLKLRNGYSSHFEVLG